MSHDSALFSAAPSVVIADDDIFLQHVAPPDHPEREQRLLAVRDGVRRAASAAGRDYHRLVVTDATEEQLVRVHTPGYIAQLGQLAGRSGHLDADTYVSPGSVAAAKRAAGAAVALVESIDGASHRLGWALTRPPGHHALADRAMGFCLLNNVAVAAAHARARGRQRVLVLDWDVHHGNGTEAMFYDVPEVLFISLHQYPNYPGTGAPSDLGARDGQGHNINVPLPPGGGDAVYAAAFERVVLRVIEQFKPDFALVSCGFDAHRRDPLAEMQLTASGYGMMTQRLLDALPEACPLGLLLEGGYDLEALTESSEAVASVLLGARAPKAPAAAIDPHAEDALRQVSRLLAPYWYLS